MKSKNKWPIRLLITVLGLMIFLGATHLFVMYKVRQATTARVQFGSLKDEESFRKMLEERLSQQRPLNDFERMIAEKVRPFEEIDPFDADAKSWTNNWDTYAACGILVFDANQDGLLDVYFLQPGDQWTRPTDEQGVLLDKPRPTYNVLYLHQGNDAQGHPIYKKVEELAAINDTHLEAELLIENFLFPRKQLTDSIDRVGRISATAVAVDLNADGRMDLIVGNMQPGSMWSHPKTQRVLGQFVQPVGRKTKDTQIPLRGLAPYFLSNYTPRDNIHDTRASARGEEALGANSVFLNMGDKDQDGIPEWKDVSRASGLEGKRTTDAILVDDFDLDGDLDVFESNFVDADFWPGGSRDWAGAANQFYVNQLAKTGELRFIERSAEMDVDGLYDAENPMPDYYKMWRIPFLPVEYSLILQKFIPYHPKPLNINGQEHEQGQLSWAAIAQDVNHDGYPDIWVGNDVGYLRLYLNEGGAKFRVAHEQARGQVSGMWMSFSAADFNGDLKEDLFGGNMGGAVLNQAFTGLGIDPQTIFEPVMTTGTLSQQFFSNRHNALHAIIDGADYTQELDTYVRHSRVLPPDTTLPNNARALFLGGARAAYDPDSLDPYEFSWGSTEIDIQNDGLMDLYWFGGLNGRAGGITAIIGSGPGRLLVNTTTDPKNLSFMDLTAENRLLNMHHLQYDKLESEELVYRRSPSQNWGKRSMVTSKDLSVWGMQGPMLIEKVSNHDLIQTSENGRGVVAADLNNDGFQDLILRNMGGYDSRDPKAMNLKAKVNGKVRVVPSHDANFPSFTNYEPGSTRTFMNTYQDNHWIKIKLVDDSQGSFNTRAVGAEVIVDDKHLRVHRVGGGGFLGNTSGALHIGLGQSTASKIRITWRDAARTVTEHLLPTPVANGSLTISKTKGILSWEPHEADVASN